MFPPASHTLPLHCSRYPGLSHEISCHPRTFPLCTYEKHTHTHIHTSICTISSVEAMPPCSPIWRSVVAALRRPPTKELQWEHVEEDDAAAEKEHDFADEMVQHRDPRVKDEDQCVLAKSCKTIVRRRGNVAPSPVGRLETPATLLIMA